jgi:hypothetical protein
MNMPGLSPIEWVLIITFAVIVVAGIGTWAFVRKRRTERLRAQFDGAEYARAVRVGGSRQQAEAGLEGRTERVESLHIRTLAPSDHGRFVESWRRVQARFVDGPGGALMEADQLLGDVMSARGYPVSDFEHRAADISVDHPSVMQNYRTAHDMALRQMRGQATTEELRLAMIHYRTLFEELVGEPEMARVTAAS